MINENSPSCLASDDRPLVTFALFAYNQEKYIREAIEGALAQTYSPLEIILSDDHSSDGTYEVMKQAEQTYRGDHCVNVRRSAKNAGFANHINEVLSVAKGNFIVMAAGDDISHENRVRRLVEERQKAGKQTCCLYSDFSTIDATSKTTRSGDCHLDFSGRSLDDFVRKPFPLLCSYAFDIELFRRFGKFDIDLRNEDFVFPFRTLLLDGKIIFVKDPLVRYRISEGHTHSEKGLDAQTQLLKGYQRRSSLEKQLMLDLSLSGYASRHQAHIEKRQKALRMIVDALSEKPPRTFFLLFKALLYEPAIALEANRRWLGETSPSLKKAWRFIKRSWLIS